MNSTHKKVQKLLIETGICCLNEMLVATMVVLSLGSSFSVVNEFDEGNFTSRAQRRKRMCDLVNGYGRMFTPEGRASFLSALL